MAQVSQSFSGLFPVVGGGHRRCFLVLALFGLVCALSVARASSSSESVKQQVQEFSDDYVSEEGDNSQAVSSILTRNSRATPKKSGSLLKKAAVLASAVVAVAVAYMKKEDIMNLFLSEEDIKTTGSPKSPEKKQAAKMNKKMMAVSTALVTAAVTAGVLYFRLSGVQQAVEDVLPTVPKDEETVRILEQILPNVGEAPGVPESLKEYIPQDIFKYVPTDPTTQAIVTLAATAIGLHVALIGPISDAVKLNKLEKLLKEYGEAAPVEQEGEPDVPPPPVRAAQAEKAALELKKAQKWRLGRMLDYVAGLYVGVYEKLSRSKAVKEE